MKQILQSLTTGQTEVQDIPAPALQPGKLLIRTHNSLVSAGTERMLVEFGQANWLNKARQQPDKVRQVLDKVRTDGILTTLDAVQSKLDQPLPLGYCNVGTVIGVGANVRGFQVGDRIISNGPHAEIVSVPQNLCAKIPESVTNEAAVFTVVAAIGLQGIRLAQPTLGECFVVIGLGLIGLLTAQLLKAQGCRVLGLDFAPDKLARAQQLGIDTLNLAIENDPIAIATEFSREAGVDGVLITAATQSSEPVHQAAQMCRQRGRIVLVGVTGLELSRADFYKKELSFQVSCSYGPGRYDPNYEQKGQDYPLGFVRWTEQRNFEAVLDTLASGQLQTDLLISHRFPIEQADQAYAVLTGDQPYLGIVLDYPTPAEPTSTLSLKPDPKASPSTPAPVIVSCIGAGNYASRILLPALAETPAQLHTLAATSGVNITHYGRKLGFQQVTTEPDSIFTDPTINTVVIATRHDSHADLVCRALTAGKHVFVEKPLALNQAELEQIQQVYQDVASQGQPRQLMVGFNRRFAPLIKRMHSLLQTMTAPKALIMTVNAGAIPADHWTQDAVLGGGRIIGEACHFVDLLRFLVGQPIESWHHTTLADSKPCPDTVTLSLTFTDGSIGTIHYFANGAKSFPKERLEIFCGDRILQLDNYRTLQGWGWPQFKRQSQWRQDKGQKACLAAFVAAITTGTPAPIPLEELIEVSQVILAMAQPSPEKL
jgi:predicted dehydrogenase/threonine dehydrogenase-like Zn-dependent dehydrogenase